MKIRKIFDMVNSSEVGKIIDALISLGFKDIKYGKLNNEKFNIIALDNEWALVDKEPEYKVNKQYTTKAYASSWLELAVKNFKEDNKTVHTVKGDTTIGEFIEKWCSHDLSKIIKID